MHECPYCSFELNGAPHRQESRTEETPGQKSSGEEIVTCPDCGGVIDGFTPH